MNYKPEEEKLTRTLSVPVTDRVFVQLAATAEEKNTTKASVVREAIDAFIANLEVK